MAAKLQVLAVVALVCSFLHVNASEVPPQSLYSGAGAPDQVNASRDPQDVNANQSLQKPNARQFPQNVTVDEQAAEVVDSQDANTPVESADYQSVSDQPNASRVLHDVNVSQSLQQPDAGQFPQNVTMDKRTAEVAGQELEAAFVAELPALEEAKVLAAPEQQVLEEARLPGEPEGEGGAPSVISDGEGIIAPGQLKDMLGPINEFEKDVTDLVLGLTKGVVGATPLGSSTRKILDLLEKDMMPKVVDAHEKNKKELKRLHSQIWACSVVRKKAMIVAMKSRTTYLATSPMHKTCRVGEASLYTSNLNCWKELRQKKQIKSLRCQAYKAISDKVGNQNQNKQMMDRGQNEDVVTYVKRITATVCGKPNQKGTGGHGSGGMLDQLLDAKYACDTALKNFAQTDKRCKALDLRWRATRAKCDNLQKVMDNAACKYAIDRKDACETYEECYTDKKESFRTMEKTIRQEEVDRKAEWKGLRRMQCIVLAFGDGKVEAHEIKACKDKTFSTSFLDIKYPNLPRMVGCSVPNHYPYTASYKKKEFTPLPALAKGRMDANDCTGIKAISTQPAPGSPASCKCQRVTMNGPFSPGALVKCENCIDVRRSHERNSCPSGTKLFAPRSRQDWQTFLKSSRPLRAPNWVVDVTRPQNGCGGCTKHPMNSGATGQRTWKTSDGSPWWLRSSRYNEPNGDYQSNCYLDLWHNPKNADSVTFNDGSCSYHSKSYYCQLGKFSVNPKPGSPTACACKRIQIASGETFSRSILLKCSNCLKVRKANDKNSCPFGTKLFAPSSRSDWKAFIASATPLRAPHWIIDITRPQNGCGGCTRFAMNSGVAAQATWRTADGAPWWLRSTRYNEPNGDYTANCYLDLWRTPVNENTVSFNDGRCNYHSKSYYCQTAGGPQALPKAATTAPPWTGSHIRCVPKSGSPKSCKCRKMKLKGTYSANALYKCENCLTVAKSKDKNSCPDGTKIFSPQNRADWKVFFASGGKPLYAPSWIVDVTRPKNGCGGCTKHPMHSASSGQSSWKTSDGTPWWFRSNGYSEPNGDYTANCYLNLWKNPKNENDIKFNDHKCNYKAKSYYCQPKNLI